MLPSTQKSEWVPVHLFQAGRYPVMDYHHIQGDQEVLLVMSYGDFYQPVLHPGRYRCLCALTCNCVLFKE